MSDDSKYMDLRIEAAQREYMDLRIEAAERELLLLKDVRAAQLETGLLKELLRDRKEELNIMRGKTETLIDWIKHQGENVDGGEVAGRLATIAVGL